MGRDDSIGSRLPPSNGTVVPAFPISGSKWILSRGRDDSIASRLPPSDLTVVPVFPFLGSRGMMFAAGGATRPEDDPVSGRFLLLGRRFLG